MPASIRWQRFFALSIAVLTALSISVTAVAPADAASKRQRKIHNAMEVARNQNGDPYRYGANGPSAFDCSGLVQYAYRKAGLRVPRTTDAQANRAHRIKKSNMRRGDLMFFHSGGDVYHVGIFTGWTKDGRRRVLHSPNSGQRVRAEGTWTGSWYAGTLRRR